MRAIGIWTHTNEIIIPAPSTGAMTMLSASHHPAKSMFNLMVAMAFGLTALTKGIKIWQ